MAENTQNFCRVCDGQLELIPEEEPEGIKTVSLWYCEPCEKFFRFVELQGEYDYENDRTVYPKEDK